MLALLPGTLVLSIISESVSAVRWTAGAGIVLAAILWRVWRLLPENHPPEIPNVYPSLGLPTQLTLLRGFLMVCVAGFILFPEMEGPMRWVPGIVYLLAAILDGFDGYAARKLRRVTRLGQILDNEFDALGTLIAVLLGIALAKLPVWYVLIGLAYYLFTLGQWLRRSRNLPVYDLQPDRRRSVFAGIQMGFLGIVLLPAYSSSATIMAAPLFFLPTAAMFVRDWFITVGTIKPKSKQYRQLTSAGTNFLTHVMLPGLRGVVFGVFLYSCILTADYTAFAVFGIPKPIVASILAGLLTLMLLGFGARFASLLLILLLGTQIGHVAVFSVSGILFYGGICILLFGAGQFSIWQPEEAFLFGDSAGGID